MNPLSVVIACSTYYPKWYQGKLRSIGHTDKIRGDLALEFATLAQKHGYRLVVADGFSTKIFQRTLRSICGETTIIIQRKKRDGRSQARKEAFYRASKEQDVRVILYTEPEKVSLISHIPKIVEPILQNKADIVIPKRADIAFRQSYPLSQYYSETEGNILYNELLHVHGLLPRNEVFDLFFGPRAYTVSSEMVAIFKTHHTYTAENVLHSEYYQPHELSDALFFPNLVALHKGLRIQSVTVPFRYPQLQRQNEEFGEPAFFIEKRKMQKMTLLIELMHFLNYLGKKKKK